MSFWKRVLSADYRRALSAEAAGEFVAAARAYALAGERDKVAEMHLLASERASGHDARVSELRAASRFLTRDRDRSHDEASREVARRIALALFHVARQHGLVSEGDRALLREAATLFTLAGDGARAGEALELSGDEQAAADAYQSAGEVERLEQVLARDEERRGEGRRLREASAEYEQALATGARRLAIERLRECLRLDPKGPSRQLLDALLPRRLAAGTVSFAPQTGRPRAVYAATFPAGIGRDPACEIPLHDARVSRRHAELLARDGGFLVRDCRSRNGTRFGGVVIEGEGEIPLVGEGEIGLGDAVTLAFRVEQDALRLSVSRGTDRGLVAHLSPRPMALAGGALTLRFEEGVPIVSLADATLSHALRLNGAHPGPAIELLRGDHLELRHPDATLGIAARLDVE